MLLMFFNNIQDAFQMDFDCQYSFWNEVVMNYICDTKMEPSMRPNVSNGRNSRYYRHSVHQFTCSQAFLQRNIHYIHCDIAIRLKQYRKTSHFVCLLAIIYRLFRLVQLMAPKIISIFFANSSLAVSLECHIQEKIYTNLNTRSAIDTLFQSIFDVCVFFSSLRYCFWAFILLEIKFKCEYTWKCWLNLAYKHTDALTLLLFWFCFVTFTLDELTQFFSSHAQFDHRNSLNYFSFFTSWSVACKFSFWLKINNVEKINISLFCSFSILKQNSCFQHIHSKRTPHICSTLVMEFQ